MPIKSMDDDYIRVAEAAVTLVNESKIPGAYWVDFIPILRYVPAWVPGAKAKQLAPYSRSILEKVRHMGFDFTKSRKVRMLYHLSTFIGRRLTIRLCRRPRTV